MSQQPPPTSLTGAPTLRPRSSHVDMQGTVVGYLQLLQSLRVVTQDPASVDETNLPVCGQVFLKVGSASKCVCVCVCVCVQCLGLRKLFLQIVLVVLKLWGANSCWGGGDSNALPAIQNPVSGPGMVFIVKLISRVKLSCLAMTIK